MSGDIVVLDDFLSPNAFENLARFICNEPMTYGSRSNFRTDPHGHWSRNFVTASRPNLADVSCDLEENEGAAPLNFAWKFLRDTRLENDVLIRCYLNGYTYGTDGYFHADSERPDEHSTILFMNDYWEPDWAGETVFLGKDGDIIKSVLPKMNRADYIPSRHSARRSRRFKEMYGSAKDADFQIEEKRSSNFEKLSAFLRKVGAGNYTHNSGTLHDHLVRTFAILETKGFDSTICFGGGLHAIYGTNSFGHRVLTRSAQAKIVDEFGPRQELARLFSELDVEKRWSRPKICYRSMPSSSYEMDRR